MGNVIVGLLPIIVAALAVPIYAIIALILLQSEGGLKKGIALIIGAVTIRILQGYLFGFVFGRVEEEYPEAGPTILVSTLLLVIGILFLVKAYSTWQKEVDPEDAPPKWMAAINDISALKAAGIGALYVLASPKQWVFTQAAISTIIEGEMSAIAEAGLYLVFVIGTQLSAIIPLAMLAISPEKAGQSLQAASEWLGRHNRTIMIIVSLIFGVWFTYKGFNGLLG